MTTLRERRVPSPRAEIRFVTAERPQHHVPPIAELLPAPVLLTQTSAPRKRNARSIISHGAAMEHANQTHHIVQPLPLNLNVQTARIMIAMA